LRIHECISFIKMTFLLLFLKRSDEKMTRVLDINELQQTYKNNHDTEKIKVRPILPFVTTRGKELKGDFSVLIGEYVRRFCGHILTAINKKSDELEFEDPLIVK